MPPRIPTSLAASCCRRSLASSLQASQPSLVSLLSALSLQTRSASILASLSDNPGAYNKRIRKGRGASSGYGKTSGRGHKGTGQRGKLNPWFQGGQTPLVFVNGRKGEDNIWAAKMSEVNLDRIQQWIDAGRLDPTKQIGPKEIIESGLIGSLKDGIKILARNADVLKQPLDIIVSRASAKAIEAIEKAGGRVVTRYYTKQSIRRLLNGTSVNTDKPLPVGAEHVDEVLEASRKRGFTYRLPDPTSRWDIEYYRDPAHRGYLSHQLQPGESPSLYFKVPTPQKKVYPKKEKAASTEISTNKDVNRLF